MPTLTITMGIPASGKTTWAQHHATTTGAQHHSTDQLRTNYRNAAQFMRRLHDNITNALHDGHDVTTDGCNINERDRTEWLNIAHHTGATSHLTIITTPTNLCIERNNQRPHNEQVPHKRMLWYARKIHTAAALTTREPWANVHHINPPIISGTSGATRTW
jgi:predicted kinase